MTLNTDPLKQPLSTDAKTAEGFVPGKDADPNKPVIINDQAKSPADAEKNEQELKDAQAPLSAVSPATQVSPNAEVNKPHQDSHPQTVASASVAEKESGPEKAKRVDTADPSNEGEGSPAGWGHQDAVDKKVYVMTNVDGEKLYVTRKQWMAHGQILRANGWTTPEFAAGNPGGSEPIPPDVDWGKDKT
jgi:hypothetical protein